jgi:uncharacterized protein
MKQKPYEGVTIDCCGHCGGVWLDDLELGAIVKSVMQTFSEQEKISSVKMLGEDHRDSGVTIKCPKCQSALEVMQYAMTSGVFIDRCPSGHGVWLDVGELEKIQIVMEQADLNRGTHQRQQTSKQTSLKACPRDGSKLKEVPYETEVIDVCPRCGGVWCDYQELAAIVSSREVVFTKEDFPEIRAEEDALKIASREEIVIDLDCVLCSKPMKRLNYSYSSGIIIDRCIDGHGVWLDHHELTRIQIFVERWQTQESPLKKKVGGLLAKAKAEARAGYAKAQKEGRNAAKNASAIGRFLKRIGL